MSERLAAQIVDNVVSRVIVGTVEWAGRALGGEWVDVSASPVGVGWLVVDGVIVPPPAPEVDPDAVLDEGVL